MPPHPSSPFRTFNDWIEDPWGDPAEKRRRRAARNRRWTASLSDRDFERLAAAAGQVSPLQPGIVFADLDAPIRVGVAHPDSARHFNGERFGALRGMVLMAWPKA